jgi:hypothetical protein
LTPEPASRVVVTSTIRWAWVSDVSAHFRILDLETGEVTFTAPVPESKWRAVDPNPRGGQRGARGVSVHGDRLVLANAESLFVFDASWRLLRQISRPLLADVHDVLAEERGIWATAAGCDALVLMGWDGELLDWWTHRNDGRLVRRLGFRRRDVPKIDPKRDYRDPRARADFFDTVHLNGILRVDDAMLLSFGRVNVSADGPGSAAIVRLPDRGPALLPRRASVVLESRPALVPNHNLGLEDDLLVYNDTNRDRIVAWDRGARVERSSVKIPGRPAFARGLAQIGPGRWLVGSQKPHAVHDVDLDAGRLVRTYELGGHENETVFGICVLPTQFAQPVQPGADEDAYAFWHRADAQAQFTPIPRRSAV